MATFTGTDIAEAIIPTFVSPTVTTSGGALPSAAADNIDSGGGNDVVAGGGGNDVVSLGDGDDRFDWLAGDGKDDIFGGVGFDTFGAGGTASSETFTLSSAGAGTARFARNLDGALVTLHDVERIEIAALGGVDTVLVQDLSQSGVTDVFIDLAATPGGSAGDGIVDTVSVRSAPNGDVIGIARVGNNVVLTGLAAEVTVAHQDAGDLLAVLGAGGDDTINALALTPDTIHLVVTGGDGNDSVFGSQDDDDLQGEDGDDLIVGAAGRDFIDLGAGDDTFSWLRGHGSDVVGGGTGFDTLVFNGSAGGETIFGGTTGQFGALALISESAEVDFTEIERVRIIAFGGEDFIGIDEIAGVTRLEIELGATPAGLAGDGANDGVALGAGDGDDHITIARSGTEIIVDGVFGQTRINQAEASRDTLALNGADGNDTIDASALPAGSIQLELLGGDGNDTLRGGAGGTDMRGEAGDDILVSIAPDDIDGGEGIDFAVIDRHGSSLSFGITLFVGEQTLIDGTEIESIERVHLIGGNGTDALVGFGFDDTFAGNGGNDVFNGDFGTDTAVFVGNRANYVVDLQEDGIVEVVDQRAGRPFGSDIIVNAERLEFADGVFAPVAPLDGIVWRHDEGSVALGDRHLGVVSTNFQVHGTGDFDGDGDLDILWRHVDGLIVTWEMEDGAFVTNHSLPQVSDVFAIDGVGDFDNDGDDDILWRGDDGEVVTWEMQDGQFVTTHNLPITSNTFDIDGTGDFDGDGDADILWRNDDGDVVTWEMEDGELVTSHNLPRASTDFRIAGTGDFDRDGDDDILWSGSDGEVVTWEMENGGFVTNHNLPQVSTNFGIAGTGDFDRDGDAEILWGSADGQVVTWEMEAGSFLVNHNHGFVAESWLTNSFGAFDLV
jgi:WD40 repeat protein